MDLDFPADRKRNRDTEGTAHHRGSIFAEATVTARVDVQGAAARASWSLWLREEADPI